MASEELKKIVAELNTKGKMSFLKAATKEQINAFETENKISFPEQYKEWLGFSDGGECYLPAGVQFYGVAHKPLIDVNDNDRPDNNYVVIGALATGDPIVFKNSEQKIAIYNHEAERIENDEIYENFFSFLNDLYDLLGIED